MSSEFTVIFDLDGTLVDSSGDIHTALRVALHEGAQLTEGISQLFHH